MARQVGPDDSLRAVYLPNGLIKAQGRKVTLYADAGLTALADVRDLDGNVIPGSVVIVDTRSRVPQFQYPDGADIVYGKIGDGPAMPLYARYDTRIVTVAQAAAVAVSVPRVYGKNMFDPDSVETDRFWNGVGSTTIPLSGWSASPKYPVTPGQTYSINNCRNYGRMDASGTAINGGYVNNPTEASVTFTVPTGTAFIVFNVATSKISATQFENGNPTTYEPYGVVIEKQLVGGKRLTDVSATVYALERLPGLNLLRDGSQMLLRTPFDSTRDLVIPMQTAGGSGQMFQMANSDMSFTALIESSAPDSTIWPVFKAGTEIHGTGDDNCPINTGWSYVGANHGYSTGSRVTAAAHGKTTADLGSQWSDGTRTYTLLQILNTDALLFANPYTVASGVTTGGAVAPAAALTHISGATNTATIPITGGVLGGQQIFPSSYGQSVTIELDGKPVLDGKSSGQLLTVTETYLIASYKGLVDVARANIGVPVSSIITQVPPLARVSNTYRFTPGGQIVIAQRVTVLEKTVLCMGVTQAYGLEIPIGGSRRQFMAGVGTAGSVNFSTIANLSAMAADINFTSAAYLDANTPPVSMRQWAYDSAGNPQYGLAMGILPVTDGHPLVRTKNAAGKPWFIANSTKKNYPQVVWAKTMIEGETVAGTAYRRYLSPPSDVSEFTVSDGTDTWVIIERTTATTEGRMSAPQILGRHLEPATLAPTITTARRVSGDGISYVATSLPAYGMWRATEESRRSEQIPGATTQVGNYFVMTQGGVTTFPFTGSFQILYMWPMELREATLVDRVTIEVTTLGTGVLRHGVYPNDPTTGMPLGAPMASFGTVDVTTIGIKDTTLAPAVLLPAGWHWYGLVWQSDGTTPPQIRAMSAVLPGGPMNIGTTPNPMSQARGGPFISGVSGTLGVITVNPSNVHAVNAPRVAYRRA